MSKKLVAYFSASGITAKVAENLAEAIGADIFEIQPEVPYTKADLNWMDKKSRSTMEMSDSTSRPGIAVKRDNMDEYDTIFVGFPIWWYIAPTIINTFLESYDLKGKTIIPFATSGGSDMGKTNEKLAPSCPGAKLLHGKVFNSYSSKADLSAWVGIVSTAVMDMEHGVSLSCRKPNIAAVIKRQVTVVLKFFTQKNPPIFQKHLWRGYALGMYRCFYQFLDLFQW